MTTESINRPIDSVIAFLSALEQLDIEKAETFLAEDAIYQNVPLPAARGRAAVTKQLGAMGKIGTGFRATVHEIAENGPTVLTERTDVLEIGAWSAEFWVCGTFHVRDGRITLWRDYFDWATLFAASARGLTRAAVHGLSRLAPKRG